MKRYSLNELEIGDLVCLVFPTVFPFEEYTEAFPGLVKLNKNTKLIIVEKTFYSTDYFIVTFYCIENNRMYFNSMPGKSKEFLKLE